MAQRDFASTNRRIEAAVCASLTALVWLVFGQAVNYQFVNFDDELYVYENPAVRHGLNGGSIGWAFTHVVASNWHPLTVLSHMLDCQLYGINPGGHHLTNIILHAATVVLLFLFLRRLTNRLWPSAFVAAVFAIHPLRVESVAWIAERKDVLSGFFFVLALFAYVHYTAHAKIKIRKAKLFYTLALFCFAFGLLSKPMLVTLPIILLLLDYWPLGRLKSPDGNRFAVPPGVIVEKVPFALFSIAICVTTWLVQKSALQSGETIPHAERLENAVVSIATYVLQLFHPANLCVFYPYPFGGWQFWQIGLSFVFVIAASVAAYRLRGKYPFLLVGWLWYLVMLLPVIGLIQVGGQAHADRYTYLPQIGLCIALTWGVAEATASWRNRSALLAACGAVIIACLAVTARAQTNFWRSSETLWEHAIKCSSPNALAENNLANYFLHQGLLNDAIEHSQAALAIKPDYPDALNCLGYALLQSGRLDEASARFQDALKLRPDFAAAHLNYGIALFQGKHSAEAIDEFKTAIKLRPALVDAHNNLGAALVSMGQPAAAVAEYQAALELDPDSAGVNNNFAWVLATSADAAVRNGNRAVPMAEHANELSGGKNLIILRTLAASYAEAGKFSEATKTANEALQLATAQDRKAWMQTLGSDIESYRSGRAIRDGQK